MSGATGQLNGPHWLFITDTHVGQSLYLHHVRTVVDLARAAAGGQIEAVIHAGDGNECPTASFLDWWHDPEGGNAPSSEQVLFTMGNHDTETDPGEPAASDPFATARSRYPWFAPGQDWYRVSIGPVSLYSLQTCSDVLSPSGSSCYPNCNPPGVLDALNPDYSGILDPQSPQRQRLAAELAQDTHPWRIVVSHRPAWAPFSGQMRPVHTALQQLYLDSGFSLALGGDIHIGSLCGPIDGLHSLTLAGGYVVRQVDLDAFPGLPVLWSSGGGGSTGLAHAALLSFDGDAVTVRIWEASNYYPAGSQVFAATLPRRVV